MPGACRPEMELNLLVPIEARRASAGEEQFSLMTGDWMPLRMMTSTLIELKQVQCVHDNLNKTLQSSVEQFCYSPQASKPMMQATERLALPMC